MKEKLKRKVDILKLILKLLNHRNNEIDKIHSLLYDIDELLQERLAMLKYPVGQLDGINGTQTQNAIQAFQKDHQLVVDGIVGMNTWQQLLIK